MEFWKSTRGLSVILCFVLIFLLIVTNIFGRDVSSEVVGIVTMAFGTVVGAYFNNDRNKN